MTWAGERRVEFIAWRLCTHGEVQRSDIARTFRVSMAQASADLAEFQRLHPGATAYDKMRRRYLPADSSLIPASARIDWAAFEASGAQS